MKAETRPDKTTPPSRWPGIGAAFFLILIGLLQTLQLKYFKLEWTSVTLILIGVTLFFLPLKDLGSLIESLEFGKTKILFRKTRDLQQSVEQAVLGAANKIGLEVEIQQTNKSSMAADSGSVPSRPSETPSGREDAESENEDRLQAANVDRLLDSLMTQDKETALIKLSIVLEGALGLVAKKYGTQIPKTGIVWSRTVSELINIGAITSEVGKALLKFRDVRNSIVHSSVEASRGDAVIISAIDSGLKLLKLLLAAAN